MTGPAPGGWGPCPPGDLERLGARLRLFRRLRIAAGVGAVLLAAAGLATGGWLALRPRPEPAPGCQGACAVESAPATPCGDEAAGKK
jgi:hypothetical protein